MSQTHLVLKGLDFARPVLGRPASYSLPAVMRLVWDWDEVVKSSHAVNCGFNMGCLFNVYVKDGLALREEQVGYYPPRNDPQASDVSPRGCPMGVCYSHRMYDPTRVKYPLKRVGERGEGMWQRVTWDQALTEIADVLIDVLATEGNEAVISMRGTNASNSNNMAASSFEAALGLPNPDTNPDTGDEQPGVALTFGKIMFGESHDNWLYSDMVIIWGSNPGYTHMPNIHYLAEARYRGARIVAIGPDYNPSAHFADLWVPINMGTDAALALAMAHVILRDGLHKPEFIREQTDLPLLVRTDPPQAGKFLTQKDMQRDGRDTIFYVFDEVTRKVVPAPHKNLALEGRVPALEGEYEADTLSGRVEVKPVFQLLKEHLREYTPEAAARTTGVSALLIERLAHDFATARGVINVSSMQWGRHYHGDLVQRAQALLWALCGHFGKVGSTFSSAAIAVPDSSFGYWFRRVADSLLSAASTDPRVAAWRDDGYTDEMLFYEYAAEAARSMAVNISLLSHFHAETAQVTEAANNWDPDLKRPVQDYLDEALRQGWQWALPRPGKEPRVIIERGGSFLRRSRSTDYLVNHLLPKLKLLVTVDPRMGSTALYSDYVLPAACGYERYALFATSPTCPWLPIISKAVEPLGEAKSDWEVYCLLAKAVQARAQERGIATFTDRRDQERRLDNVYDQVTVHGLYTEHDEEGAARDFYLNTVNAEQMEWEELKEKGYAHLTAFGRVYPDSATDIVPGEPVVPLAYHVHGKRPYPTQTRRIQFYIDHDWFLELGEALPTHKDIPPLGGNYPLQVSGGHNRWSIHSLWKDNPLLLRLQRGEPIMYISAQDAALRNIKDGDRLEVSNELASFEVQAAVSPAVRPGQVIIYHDWENFQFPGKRHFKSVTPSPLNPTDLVGNYHHIRPRMVPLYACSPGPTDRGVRVEVKKV